MVSCCLNIFRFPHLTNPHNRVRIFQFFIRLFVFVNFLISTVVLTATVVIRIRFALPYDCSDSNDDVYMPAYILICVSIIAYLCMFLTCVRSRRYKNSKNLTGHVILFLIIVSSEVFISIMTIVQTNRVSYVIEDRSNVFNSGNCLNEIQSQDGCCGFHSYQEWPNLLNESVIDTQVKFEYTKLNTSFDFNIYNYTSPVNVFPESCQCLHNSLEKCITLNYSLTFQNLINGLNYSSLLNKTENEIFASFPQTFTTLVNIYSSACIFRIADRLKLLYKAVGFISLFAFASQIILFCLVFYITHNLEGAATVSDVYRSSDQSFDPFYQRRSGKISVVNIRLDDAEEQRTRQQFERSSNKTVSAEKSSTQDSFPETAVVINDSIGCTPISIIQSSKSIDIIF